MPLTFTRAWEDDRLDVEVLRVLPGERVLVVAAAGDTALALAADGAQVTAVDLNPEQLRLVALKLAAARVLYVPTLHRWFEAGRAPDAPLVYRDRVRQGLDPVDSAYWDTRIGLLVTGLHQDGGVGRPFLRLGRAIRFLRPGLEREVEQTADVTTQAEWWRRHVRPLLANHLVHGVAARTRVLSPLAPNPEELDRMRRGGWSHGLVERIDGVVGSVLVRQHPWWRPAFSGRPADPGDGAAWLDETRVRALAGGVPKLDLAQGDLAEVLRSCGPGSLDAVSVSNVPDWLNADGSTALAAAVRHALAPGGRVLVRRVVGPGAEDPFERAGLRRDPVSDTLAARDRTALYERVDLYRQ